MGFMSKDFIIGQRIRLDVFRICHLVINVEILGSIGCALAPKLCGGTC